MSVAKHMQSYCLLLTICLLVISCHTSILPVAVSSRAKVQQQPNPNLILKQLDEAVLRRQKNALRDRAWFELLNNGQSDQAVHWFERAQKEAPADWAIHLGNALLFHDRGEYQQAGRIWWTLLGACQGNSEAGCQAARLIALQKLSSRFWTLRENDIARLTELSYSSLDALARDEIFKILERHAQLHGNKDLHEKIRLRRGCVRDWTLSGPHYRFVRRHLESPPNPSAKYSHLVADSCQVELPTDNDHAGIFHLQSQMQLPNSSSVEFIVEASALWQFYLDGRLLWNQLAASSRPAGRVRFSLPISAGQHELMIKIGVPAGVTEDFSLVALSLGTKSEPIKFGTKNKNTPKYTAQNLIIKDSGCSPSAASLMAQLGGASWYKPLVDFLIAQQAFSCRDLDLAYPHVEAATKQAPNFSAAEMLKAAVILDDPSIEDKLAAEWARKIYANQWQRDSTLGRALYNLAMVNLQLDKDDEALISLRMGEKHWPRDYIWQVGLAQYFRRRSFAVEEELALQSAIKLEPQDCSLYEELAKLQRRKSSFATSLESANKARACNAQSELAAQFVRDLGKHRQALAEYRRLLDLRPGDRQLRKQIAELNWKLGEKTEAKREFRRLLAADPQDTDTILRAADLQAADGELRLARDNLRLAMEQNPWRQELRRAWQNLAHRTLLDPYRENGPQIIRDYLATPRLEDAPSVMILDRTVHRINQSGAGLILTHNIVRVLNKEGIERFGEVSLPERAEVLTLRVVKADGSMREPEEIQGKKTISLPDLDKGDFVEMEYVESISPPQAFDGAIGPRFYFRTFDAPMVRSEYLVVAPRGLKLNFDSRNGAASPLITKQGEFVQYKWLVRNQPRLLFEPGAVSPEEFLPSTMLTSGATWEIWRDYYAERMAAAVQPTWHMRELVRRLTSGLKSPRTKAETIYRWVLEHIEPSGPALESAAIAINRGRGSRYAVLTALLRLANISAEIWLAHPTTYPPLDAQKMSFADAQGFSSPVVFCPLSDGPLYLIPRSPMQPLGYVDPELRGALALRLGSSQKPLTKISEQTKEWSDWREIKLQAQLDEQGAASITGHEMLDGASALFWRNLIRRQDSQRLREIFEQGVLNIVFPGADLESLNFEEEKNPHLPLKINYSFKLPRLCNLEGGSLRCLFSSLAPDFRRTYLRLARREFPMHLAFYPFTRLVLEIKFPATMRLGPLPAPAHLKTDFGEIRLQYQSPKNGTLRIVNELSLPLRRVTPAEYESFTKFALSTEDFFREPIVISR